MDSRISANKLAKEFNVSKNKILRILRDNKIEIRKSTLTEQESLDIVNRYKNGESSYKLAKEFSVSKQAVLYILRKNKVKMRESGSPRKVPIKDTTTIIQRYIAGEECTDISKTYECHSSQITKILHREGVKVRKFVPMSKEWVREKRRQFSFNEDFFLNIDKDTKAYWLGFIAADGYVGKNNLSICLKRQDKNHLSKFLKNLNANYEIRNTEAKVDFGQGLHVYEQSTINISSIKLCESLRKQLQLIEGKQKTYILEFPIYLPKNQYRHFIRGLLDGDGSIQYLGNSDCKVVFYGTKSICEGVRDIIVEFCGVSNLEVRKKQGHLYEVKWAGRKQVLKILDWLYLGTEIYLERKYKYYLDIPREFKELVNILEMTTGDRIKQARIQLGLSRKQLGELIGCSVSYINAIENEYRARIDKDFANQLFKILKIKKP